MSLGPALLIAQQLRDLLAQEVSHSKEARFVLKDVSTQALFEYAAAREGFNQQSARLSAELTRAIEVLAHAQGTPDVTLDQLRVRFPADGESLAQLFAEFKSLAAALSELDGLNQHLAERALTFVRAYLNQLQPRSAAYTRAGRVAPSEATTLSEHV
jgi:hypothetical protein